MSTAIQLRDIGPRLLAACGGSQRALARRVGISHTTVNRIAHGAWPTLETIVRSLRAYGGRVVIEWPNGAAEEVTL